MKENLAFFYGVCYVTSTKYLHMPITSSAKKALRAAKRRRVFNLSRKSDIETGVKKLKKLVAAKDKKGAHAFLPTLYKALDKAAKTGHIKPNNAARRKSRMAAMVKKIA
jgi:small subunit ribosomal protein S20